MRSLLLNKYLWSLTLGHFSIDLYAGAMPVVLAALAGSMHLSFEQVGLVSALYTLCSSVSQPFFGYLSDRFGGRSFASIGLVWMSILQGAIGFVPDYPTLLVLAPLAGFGSAAFHPQGASSANIASGERKTAGMAIFLLGGGHVTIGLVLPCGSATVKLPLKKEGSVYAARPRFSLKDRGVKPVKGPLNAGRTYQIFLEGPDENVFSNERIRPGRP